MITTSVFLFFFNDTATTEIYTLSLHDALPIFPEMSKSDTWPQVAPFVSWICVAATPGWVCPALTVQPAFSRDRKSTRLNSSHANISYAVFCLKKNTNNTDAVFFFTEKADRAHD